MYNLRPAQSQRPRNKLETDMNTAARCPDSDGTREVQKYRRCIFAYKVYKLVIFILYYYHFFFSSLKNAFKAHDEFFHAERKKKARGHTLSINSSFTIVCKNYFSFSVCCRHCGQ